MPHFILQVVVAKRGNLHFIATLDEYDFLLHDCHWTSRV